MSTKIENLTSNRHSGFTLIDLRYVARQEPNKNRVTLSDEELIKAVWSRSMVKVAKELGVSDTCIKKT